MIDDEGDNWRNKMNEEEIKRVEENPLYHQLEKNDWPVRNNPKYVTLKENSQILIGTDSYPFVIYLKIFFFFFFLIFFFFFFTFFCKIRKIMDWEQLQQ